MSIFGSQVKWGPISPSFGVFVIKIGQQLFNYKWTNVQMAFSGGIVKWSQTWFIFWIFYGFFWCKIFKLFEITLYCCIMKRRWVEGTFYFREAISQSQPEIKIVKVINNADDKGVEEWWALNLDFGALRVIIDLDIYLPHAHHYKLRLVYLLLHFWRQFLCFQFESN